jgi:hypothetical protein
VLGSFPLAFVLPPKYISAVLLLVGAKKAILSGENKILFFKGKFYFSIDLKALVELP